MWTERQLIDDLHRIGLEAGATLLVHSSLRAVGKIEGGGDTLVRAIRTVLGEEGTLAVPTFTFGSCDPEGWREPPATPEALKKAREEATVFDCRKTPTQTEWMGIFPELVRRLPEAQRSNHPVVSFTAVGANAAFLTRNAPFHYPLGTDSPLARLHQLDGQVLLLGTSQTTNSSLHLAEIWANVPYIHRSATIKTGEETWAVMRGSPECSEGFRKVEPLLRQARLLRHGYIGNAPSQLMRQRQVVSMAITLLQGDGAALLCDVPDCPWCARARRFTADSY